MWSQTTASTVARQRMSCVKSARYRTWGLVGMVNKRPQASFEGGSYSLLSASYCHMGSVLSDFLIFQEKLLYEINLGEVCKMSQILDMLCLRWLDTSSSYEFECIVSGE